MKNHGHIITAAVLAMAASCTGKFDNGSGKNIEFRAGVETKAFLNSEDLNVAGTQLTVWGFDGTAFIPGKTASYSDADGWTLENEYTWASGKNYSFFAWLSKDKDGHTAPAVNMEDRTLTVLSRAFDLAEADNSFDFCYSNVVYRSADKPDHSVVNLNLKHLYTAIAFSAHNYTDSRIEVKEVCLCGLKNQKRATINFADTGSEAAYDMPNCTWTAADGAADGSKKLNSSTIILNPDVECANIVGTASATPAYYMFWPQTSGELTAEGWGDSDHQPSGGAYLKIVYEQDGVTFTKYARFPQENNGTADLGWPAGTKRMMQLAFRNQQVTLELSVLPWDYTESEVRYDEEVVVASPLQFDSATCTVDAENRMVYFNGAHPITGSFHITSPDASTWVISKEGDFDAFEIDDAVAGKGGYGDGEDRNHGEVDVTDGNSFTLYPMPVAEGRDYSITLSVSIRYPNGESYCIDEKVQPEGKWTIILTK